MIYALYKRLLTLYPKNFRDRFSESMQQTFSDLYNKKQNKRSFSFVLWIFVETTIAIAKEHVFLIKKMNMKSIMTNPKSAALISFLLALPIGLIYLVFMSDVEFLTQILNQWFTVTGEGGDINMLGRIVMFGGLLFLPIAFILNLLPILKKDELNGIRVLHKVNLAVGAVILLLILFTWGGLILESIYCAQGIRCD